MNLTFSRLFATSRKNSANWFTRLLFGWFLLCSGSAASADESAALASDVASILSVLNTRLDQSLSSIGSDVSANGTTLNGIKQQVQYLRSDLASDLSTINGNVTDVEDYLRQINNKLPNSFPDYSSFLSAISVSLSSLSSQNHSDLGDLKTSVAAFKTQENSDQYRNWLMLSNIWERSKVSRGGVDVLAGNPWWATNSLFVKYEQDFNIAFPDYPGGNNQFKQYSFPEIFSLFMASMYPLNNQPLSGTESAYRQFGWSLYSSQNSNHKRLRGYSWFDWMADAMKSNHVLQVSSLSALRGISNAVGYSSSGSFEDVLAANPYWVTNSSFAAIWADWNNYVPQPQDHNGYSFPEAFSMLLSHRFSDSVDRDSLFADWGIGGQNAGRFYSFEDWVAEAIKSNLVLTTSTSVSNLEAELAATDYEDPVAPTNTPLPGYVDLIREGDTSAGASEISTGQTRVLNQVDALSGMLDSATPSSEIVVIPEMTIGGIHVAEHRAQLATSITPVAHRIMFFLWYVALFSSLFSLAQGEFAFYASLGRHWSISHGALTERN